MKKYQILNDEGYQWGTLEADDAWELYIVIGGYTRQNSWTFNSAREMKDFVYGYLDYQIGNQI